MRIAKRHWAAAFAAAVLMHAGFALVLLWDTPDIESANLASARIEVSLGTDAGSTGMAVGAVSVAPETEMVAARETVAASPSDDGRSLDGSQLPAPKPIEAMEVQAVMPVEFAVDAESIEEPLPVSPAQATLIEGLPAVELAEVAVVESVAATSDQASTSWILAEVPAVEASPRIETARMPPVGASPPLEADDAMAVDPSVSVESVDVVSMEASAAVDPVEARSAEASPPLEADDAMGVDPSSPVELTEVASMEASPPTNSGRTVLVEASLSVVLGEVVPVETPVTVESTGLRPFESLPTIRPAQARSVEAFLPVESVEVPAVERAEVMSVEASSRADSIEAAKVGEPRIRLSVPATLVEPHEEVEAQDPVVRVSPESERVVPPRARAALEPPEKKGYDDTPRLANVAGPPSREQRAAVAHSVRDRGEEAGTSINPDRGTQRTGAGAPGAREDYLTLLRAWLEKHKEYPFRARVRGQEGTALLYFLVDGDGRLRNHELRQSTGYALLDREVLAMVARAQPLPSAPDHLDSTTFELIIPVRFFLR